MVHQMFGLRRILVKLVRLPEKSFLYSQSLLFQASWLRIWIVLIGSDGNFGSPRVRLPDLTSGSTNFVTVFSRNLDCPHQVPFPIK